MTGDAGDARSSPSLNPFSDAFDASLALRAAPEDVQAQLPTARDRRAFGKAQPLNNVAMCASVATAPFRVLRAAPVRKPDPKPEPEGGAQRSKRPRGEELGGAALAPRFGVLAQMHRRQAAKSGPLAMLERAVRLRRRVRIMLRETHAIRGDVSGVVVAFDKHFNMVVAMAVIRDKGERPRRSKVLFVRGENVVLVALE